ncbi:MAG: glycosyltransferase, partial [Candidatus Electrothrix sp. ATG1]|nr:glycosyltransferase [Candidatus Electrothrix sp. ATG1]
TSISAIPDPLHRVCLCLDYLLRQTRCSGSGIAEILVVDGGSTDQTTQEIHARGITPVASLPGRGTQQHTGALTASGDILLFLHCDTTLPNNFPKDIRSTLRKKNVAAGAFKLKINGPSVGLRLVEAGVLLRSTLFALPYGDQALFMHKETYFTAGGFPDQPIMEDVALVHRLRKLGKIGLAQNYVTTSARRWHRHGLVKTTLINQLMLLGRAIGISPQQLARFYYAQRK